MVVEGEIMEQTNGSHRRKGKHRRYTNQAKGRGRYRIEWQTDQDFIQTDVDVGRRLRTLRQDRQLTIRALAENSGLNVNTLSLIENGIITHIII